MYKFVKADAIREKCYIKQWIRDYFEENADESTHAIIGISGGVDSTVAAVLCVEALGRDRVFGVLMPDHIQEDIKDSKAVVELLGIRHTTLNIRPVMTQFYETFNKVSEFPNDIVKFNTPARIRMTMLYAVAGQVGGRVVNTCNLSESYVGYDTKWGDNVGDFSPLANFTKTEVRLIGEALGLPHKMIHKPSADGMCGMNDEERFGFTYNELDSFIRYPATFIQKGSTNHKIFEMNKRAQHKLTPMPIYFYRPI